MDVAKGVDIGTVETCMLTVAPKYGNWQTKEQRHRGTKESICWHRIVDCFHSFQKWKGSHMTRGRE